MGHITPALFQFFRELQENNNKEWFEANKSRYEQQVKAPLMAFITDFGVRLAEISPHYTAIPKAVGGSMFRIYRDVRFSKDKTPYKTHAGLQFRHAVGKDAHAPGFYLHLEPDSVFGGGGIWHPDNPTLAKIRAAIDAQPDKWEAALIDPVNGGKLELGGDSLKRPPKGYDKDHPHLDDLKRKDFFVMATFSEADACANDFIDRYAAACRRITGLMEFLTKSLELSW